ncbi:MAG: UDP-N-acetylmuramoyl-tripeptide--D-alanyl-D-alanine ligase, partial [bacterium]|nr:UDP-N-acetylmuramoyl-tripeptide--D-alanyl-D-alanine ligase [bacterium]
MPFFASVAEVRDILSITPITEGISIGDVGSKYLGPVILDSREVVPGCLFIARRGESGDGHDYLAQVIAGKAGGCVVEEVWARTDVGRNFIADHSGGACFFVVNDSTQALGCLAAAWREKLDLPTVAITGSNGKTTTKQILSTILGIACGQGTANIKSYNNHVGLPQTILSSSPEDSWMVLEAGMNHPGELEYLGGIARPDIAVFLGASFAHIGAFSNVADVAAAKSELLMGVRDGGTAVVNGDDALMMTALASRMRERFGKQGQETLSIRSFARDAEADLRYSVLPADGGRAIKGSFSLGADEMGYYLPLAGLHNGSNFAAAFLAARELFPQVDPGIFVAAAKEVKPAEMRLGIENLGRLQIINDAYNANPASMMAAIDVACAITDPDRLVCVIGDMLELGELSRKLHEQVGDHLARCKVAHVVLVGNESKVIAGRLSAATDVYLDDDIVNAADYIVRLV